MTRPDLDAIEEEMKRPTFYASSKAALALNSLFFYCRELEAENKRLREESETRKFQKMLDEHAE